MDVDDLTVIAYLLRTSPAALLTPPEDETTLTGVPEKFLPEEVEKWARGELVLTNEGLLLYWQQEWVQSLSRIQYFESLLRHGSPSQASHDESAQRLADLKERQRSSASAACRSTRPGAARVRRRRLPAMSDQKQRRSRSRQPGSIQEYATREGKRWRFQIYVPKDPEYPEQGMRRLTCL